MGRIAVILGLLLMWVLPASAGQASSSFHVGITILPPGSASGLSVPKRKASTTSPFFRSLAPVRRYTWGAASVALVRAGFSRFAREGQADFVYFFRAQRNGEMFRVAVSASTGVILKVWPA